MGGALRAATASLTLCGMVAPGATPGRGCRRRSGDFVKSWALTPTGWLSVSHWRRMTVRQFDRYVLALR